MGAGGAGRAGGDDLSQSPTITSPALMTAAGMILGTAAYMSPEQAKGRPVDRRCDVWAFGAVLFEMLTGTRAFEGDGVSETLARVIEREPAWNRLPATVSPALRTYLKRCLEKDPRQRIRDIGDVRLALEGAFEAATPQTAVTFARPAGRPSVWAAALAVAATVIVALAIPAVRYLREALLLGTRQATVTPMSEYPRARFEVATPPTSDPMSFALSPDGRLLAFVATADGRSRIWVRPLAQVTARAIDGTENASHPFWAPDGRAVAFFADGKLRRIDLAGGPPQIIADAPNGRGGAWSREDVIVFAPATTGTLMRVPAVGGTPAPATRLSAVERSHRWPQFLPDGRRFLYLSTQGGPGSEGVYVGGLDREAMTRVLAEDSPAAYAPAEGLVIVRQGALVSIPFDQDREVVSGEPSTIARPVGFDPQLVRGAFAASTAGVIAYRTAIAARRQLMWVDRAGRAQGTVGPPDEDGMAGPELTRDGRRVAIFRSVDGNTDVWTLPVEVGIPSRLTFDAEADAFPLWSPDERRILLQAVRRGHWHVLDRSITGDENSLFRQSEVKIPLDFSTDGRFLLYAVQVPGTGVDLWVTPFPVNEDHPPFPFAQMPFDEMAGQFHPSGSWVAFQANATGQLEIYVRPFPGPGSQQQVSLGGGSQPRWSRDGRELFYMTADGRMMAIPIGIDVAAGTLEASAARPLFQTQLATGANIPPAVGSKAQYAVGPDGRFLMNLAVEGAPAPPITVVLNGPPAGSK